MALREIKWVELGLFSKLRMPKIIKKGMGPHIFFKIPFARIPEDCLN